MSVAVCMLTCDRKRNDIYSIARCMDLDGDYSLYINHEGTNPPMDLLQLALQEGNVRQNELSLDTWSWNTAYGRSWRNVPKFDQDQARVAPIVIARNMCIEYAMQTNSSHLLFVDADIIPPHDIIPKLLETEKDAVAGLVHGRGIHGACRYVFQEKGTTTVKGNPDYQLIECEHANIGFTMISRKLYQSVRFRYGSISYPDGRERFASDDPCYHFDCFLKFGEWMYVRTDVVGQHKGDLKEDEVAQY